MVDTEQKLEEFLATLKQASWVAVDTEADSLHAYPEKVCLIQVSTRFGDRLVDPLAGLDLGPVLKALSAHEIIMHGADYDLRLLRKHHEFIPAAIFDTMLAARLLGVRQFGLSNLTETYLGVKLEKGPQKANWAMRPLTERMECYARNDTHYLKPLADCLKQALELKGRLSWHQESCARLIQDSTQERSLDMDLIWRVKGSHHLGRPGLAILRELWRWRETEAVAANRPPFFVMSHEKLVELAAAAANGGAIGSLLPRHLSERRRLGLLKAITRGSDLAAEHHPRILKSMGRRPNEAEKRRFQELQNKRDARAAELEIDPTLIASRGTLSELAHNWEMNSAALMNWQRELLKG
ncbi:MAG TPA: HRDC domain-containing protein [Candidatus Limnocylindrales bacterium]|nr:HRDC domain-containing protein [Candidatus Limnocylindrales bacterium]